MAEVINKIIFATKNLEDSRARYIAESEKLIVGRILLKYLELTYKLIINHQGNLEKYIDSQRNLLDGEESLACGAVMHYELTKRDPIQFPVSEKSPITNKREIKSFEIARSLNGIMGRSGSIESHEAWAENYVNGMGLVNMALRELEDV